MAMVHGLSPLCTYPTHPTTHPLMKTFLIIVLFAAVVQGLPPVPNCEPLETQSLLVTGSESGVSAFALMHVDRPQELAADPLDIVMASPTAGTLRWMRGLESFVTFVDTPNSDIPTQGIVSSPGAVRFGTLYPPQSFLTFPSFITWDVQEAPSYALAVYDNLYINGTFVPRVVYTSLGAPIVDAHLVALSGLDVDDLVFAVQTSSMSSIGIIPNDGSGGLDSGNLVWIHDLPPSLALLLPVDVDIDSMIDISWGAGNGILSYIPSLSSAPGSVVMGPVVNITVLPSFGQVTRMAYDTIYSSIPTFAFVNAKGSLAHIDRDPVTKLFGQVYAVDTGILGIADIVLVDFDGDFDNDLAIASQTESLAGWFINRKNEDVPIDQVMAPKLRVANTECLFCSAVISIDIDRDSDQDLFLASPASNAVLIIMSTPVDLIQSRILYSPTPEPSRFSAAVDVDRDMNTDLVRLSRGRRQVVYYLNQGNAVLDNPVFVGSTMPTMFEHGMAVMDVDGNAYPDVVTVSAEPNLVYFLFGNVDLFPDTYYNPSEWDLVRDASDWGLTQVSALLGLDLNADGSLDFVFADRTGSLVYVLGASAAATSSAQRRDHWATVSDSTAFHQGILAPNLTVQRLNCDEQPPCPPFYNIIGLKAGDLDQDGVEDVVFYNGGNVSSVIWFKVTQQTPPHVDSTPIPVVLPFMSYPFYLLGSTGDPPDDPLLPGPLPDLYDILVTDFNQDSIPDIAVTIPTHPGIFVFTNFGDGGTSWSSPGLPVPSIGFPPDAPGLLRPFNSPGNGPGFVFGATQGGILAFFRSIAPGIYKPNILSAVFAGIIYTVDVLDFSQTGTRDVVISTRTFISIVPGTTMWTTPIPLLDEVSTVDVASCGYTIECIVRAYEGISQCSLDPLVTIPPGIYTGCPLGTADQPPISIHKSVTFRGLGNSRTDVVLDCQGSDFSAVLFDMVTPGVSLTLESLTVVGLRAPPGTTSGITASANDPTLVLRDVVLAASSSSSQGGVVSVNRGGTLHIEDSVLENNVASTGGGAVAFITAGPDNVLTLTRSVFRNNRATGGDGGGVFVRLQLESSFVLNATDVVWDGNASPSGVGGGLLVDASSPDADASILLRSCTASGNSARLAGGGMAFAGRANVVIERGASFVSNTAQGIGGGLAYLSHRTTLLNEFGQNEIWASTALSPLPSPTPSAPLVPLVLGAPGDAPGSYVLEGNQAKFGGLLALCGSSTLSTRVPPGGFASTSLAAGANEGTRGGDILFSCHPIQGGSRAAGDTSLLWTEPSPSLSVLVSDERTMASTPPSGLGWGGNGTDNRIVLITGVARGEGARRVQLLDYYGNPVRDTDATVIFEVLSIPPALVVLENNVDTFATTLSGATPMAELAVSLAPVSIPHDGQFQVTVRNTRYDAPVALQGPLEISECPPGYGLATQVPATCRLCVPGEFSDQISLDICQQCPTSGFSDLPGATECTFCLSGSQRVARNDSNADTGTTCSCFPGLFAPDPAQPGVCEPCPTGALCEGGFSWPRALPGFYDVSPSPGSSYPDIQQCRVLSSCTGSNVCASGAGGYMCSLCSADHYRNDTGECQACSPVLGVVLGVFLAVSFVFSLAFGGFMWWRLPGIEAALEVASSESRASLRHSRVPHSLLALVLFLQVMSVLGSVPLSWPSSLQSLFRVFTIVNLDSSLLANECYLGSFAARYTLSLVWPAVMGALFVAGFVLSPCLLSSIRRPSAGTAAKVLVSYAGVVAYFPLVRLSLVFLDCARLPDGRYVLDSDLGFECYEGQWWGIAVVGLFALIVYVVGLPVSVAYLLYSARSSLWDAPTLSTVGPLFKLYRSWAYWGSLGMMIRTFFLVSAVVFFSHAQTFLFLSMLSLFVGSAIGYLRLGGNGPFFWPPFNLLHAYLEAALAGLMVVGWAFYVDVFPGDAVRTTFIVFTFVVVLGVVVVVGYTAVMEARRLRNLNASVIVLDNGDVLGVREAWFWASVNRDQADWEDPVLIDLVNTHKPF